MEDYGDEYGDDYGVNEQTGRIGAEGPMDDEQFQGTVRDTISAAVDYIDTYVAPMREAATAYYRGDLFGNEEEGRSQIVMTEVRDVVQAMMPALLRIFTSSEKAVEFIPRREDSVEMAEQATDYVNYVFYQDNSGFKILFDAFKDALVRKTGVVQWRVDEITDVRELYFENLDEAQYLLFAGDPTYEILSAEQIVVQEGMMEPMSGMMLEPPVVAYNIRVRLSEKNRKIVVEALPPEEFLIDRNARDIETAEYVGRRQLKTISDLVAMGYDRAEVEEYAGESDSFEFNLEAQTRNPAMLSLLATGDAADGTMQRVFYVESYIRVDKDGDGIAELRKVCTIGNNYKVIHDEVIDETPIAFFCPDPEPHTVIGASVADQVMDLQLIKSSIMRNTLDSLAQVIHPRTVVVEGQVNLDDVMNTETGSIIRARAPGMVQPLAEPFVGQAAMGMVGYLDDVRAQRTGISKASQGLDPDVLQSTTKAAVTATVSAAQERIELIARIFAETGMKRLMKGLLRTIIQYQDRPRIVRLRGKYVEVDPRVFDPNMDVMVNVGLGNGSAQERIAMLMMIATKQQEAIQMLGPANPVADLAQARNTYAKVPERAGFKDVGRYFKPIDDQAMAAIQEQMSANQQPDPAAMLAEVERQKILADIEINAAKLRLEEQKVRMADDRERDRLDADVLLRAAEIQAKYGAQVNIAAIKADIDRERNMMTAMRPAQ